MFDTIRSHHQVTKHMFSIFTFANVCSCYASLKIYRFKRIHQVANPPSRVKNSFPNIFAVLPLNVWRAGVCVSHLINYLDQNSTSPPLPICSLLSPPLIFRTCCSETGQESCGSSWSKVSRGRQAGFGVVGRGGEHHFSSHQRNAHL